jgi:peptide/nickel transport system substrate-binding protein
VDDLPQLKGLDSADSRITRRSALLLGGQGAAALGAGWLLAACGASGQSGTTAAATGKPVRGGTMTAGLMTGGTAETVNPALAVANSDICRAYQLFNYLFYAGPEIGTVVPGLALSADSNDKATTWVFKLRPGVTWHDGKPFTADDVVYTVKSWSSPNNYASPTFAGLVDFGRVRKQGKLAVEVPLTSAVADFPSLLTLYNNAVIQDGATTEQLSSHPIGTGPFKFVSFTPGKTSTFAANHDYWESGKPYVDELKIDSSFTDENARLNALLSNGIDVLPAVPYVTAKAQESSGQTNVLRAASNQALEIIMRVDETPFVDPRARKAMKLVADRQALVDTVLAGYGSPANDLIGPGCRYYDDSLKATRDVEQAQALMKEAGLEDTTFILSTSNVLPGFSESATAFAAQASEAGIKVKVQQIPPATFFTTSGGFLERPFTVDNITGTPDLVVTYRAIMAKDAPYNETHWGQQKGAGPANAKLTEAIAETNPQRAETLWQEVQQTQFDEGGDLIWGTADWVDLTSHNVAGLKTTAAFNLNNFRLLDGWKVS